MAKFMKAKPEQAKFKLGLYGMQGSGKTLTSLLFAEGLAQRENKRVAYIDTERGTDFYAMDIKERSVHPAAFDFDAIYTRSLMETLEAVSEIDTNVYGVVIIDSITHLWEAAREAYTGKRLSNGAIPLNAWGEIKKPYKQLMERFINGNFHAIICGREGVQMEKNEESGEAEVVGAKMKAEGETPFEPHILIRMYAEREKNGLYTINAFFEKDRSGVLTGKVLQNPDYVTIEPIINYLSGSQGTMTTAEEAAERDSAALERMKETEERDRRTLSSMILTNLNAARTLEELRAAWDLTKGKKTKLGPELDKLEVAKEAKKTELLQAV
jgi:hypothetical protein